MTSSKGCFYEIFSLQKPHGNEKIKERVEKCYVPKKLKQLENINRFIKELQNKISKEHVETATLKFYKGDLDQKEDPKISNDDFFIPNLVDFITRVILRDFMTHCHISTTAQSYSINI